MMNSRQFWTSTPYETSLYGYGMVKERNKLVDMVGYLQYAIHDAAGKTFSNLRVEDFVPSLKKKAKLEAKTGFEALEYLKSIGIKQIKQ